MKFSYLIFFCLICYPFRSVVAQDIFINKDTTVNSVWQIPQGVILKFGSRGHISGNGTIRGGILDAALGQFIFDTTLTLFPEGTYGKDFSARWFGAGRVKDNSAALQKGINTVLANHERLRDFFIPKGIYDFSKPLTVSSIYKGQYIGSTIHIYGETSFWDCLQWYYFKVYIHRWFCAGTSI